jgi:hypothetical protein
VSGETYTGAVFVDASYEGDLLALANVTFTVGREGRTQYNESLAGNQGGAKGHEFTLAVDPLSNLTGQPLPLLPQSGSDPGTPGQGDAKVRRREFSLFIFSYPIYYVRPTGAGIQFPVGRFCFCCTCVVVVVKTQLTRPAGCA